jgi:hypothetical protein
MHSAAAFFLGGSTFFNGNLRDRAMAKFGWENGYRKITISMGTDENPNPLE